ncbi:hypothetical protein [Limimaricola sp.]|uniref:hypothetical protein n=1 Tax=Limimaricola sp. TaxID=2211665 RepID=UPI004059BAE0
MGIFNSIDFGPTPSFGPDFNAQWTKRAGALYDALQLLEDNIVGPVSQSGGVPTGAIIERGSNSNGEFVRFADGTQICTSPDYTADSTTAEGGIYRNAAPITWTPPAAFISTNGMSGGVVNFNNSATHWGAVRPVTATSAEITIFSGRSLTGRNFRAHLLGRWY